MICPKCNYQRKPDDDAADWQCPACGIAYAKFQHNSESPAPAHLTPNKNQRWITEGSDQGVRELETTNS
jgi:ribosomal protein L37AE/L43A